jgi:serine/threonine-protein kinase HipA
MNRRVKDGRPVVNERLDVVLDDDSLGPTTMVGTLLRERGRSGEVISFEYDADYLTLPWSVELDPELPLHRGRHHPTQMRGLFGSFRDTMPDRWGRILLERREALEAKQQGRRDIQPGAASACQPHPARDGMRLSVR